MGVMSCSRYECQHIMCDTYIPEFGYICWECQDEFKTFIKDKLGDEVELSEWRYIELLVEFKTSPIKRNSELIDVNKFFNSYRRE